MGDSDELQSTGRRLKFLFVTAEPFPAARSDVNELFCDELTARGHTIDWIQQSRTPSGKAHSKQLGSGTAWIAATDTGNSLATRLRKHLYALANDLRMWSLVRRNEYDFIQVMDRFLPALMAIILARLRGIPFVYWLSFPFPEESLFLARHGMARYPILYRIRGCTIKFLLYKIIIPASDHIFAQSDEMKRKFVKRGVNPDIITAVPMGVSLERIAALKRTLPNVAMPGSEPIVAYLGELGKARKLDFLLRAFQQVRTLVPNARLTLIGSTENPQHIQDLVDLASSLGLQDAIEFTGWQPKKTAWKYAALATICVSPIDPTPVYWVSSPTKIVEYMALGKAVVANDIPDQKFLLDASGSGICTPYEETAFANAIATLLKDPVMASAMGARGQAYIEKHRSYSVLADRVERKYYEIVRNCSHTPCD